MTRVHPALLYNGFMDNLNESAWRATLIGMVGSSTCFLVTQILCAVAALCAFAVKILAVGFALLDTEMCHVLRFLVCLSLMVQCMGAVMMEQVLQDRLMLFVFGGIDATYSDDEIAYKNVYESRLFKQIWMEFWRGEAKTCLQSLQQKFKAIVLLATFDHYDLQKLLIEADSNVEFLLKAADRSPLIRGSSVEASPWLDHFGRQLLQDASIDETDEYVPDAQDRFTASPEMRIGAGLEPILEIGEAKSLPDQGDDSMQSTFFVDGDLNTAKSSQQFLSEPETKEPHTPADSSHRSSAAVNAHHHTASARDPQGRFHRELQLAEKGSCHEVSDHRKVSFPSDGGNVERYLQVSSTSHETCEASDRSRFTTTSDALVHDSSPEELGREDSYRSGQNRREMYRQDSDLSGSSLMSLESTGMRAVTRAMRNLPSSDIGWASGDVV